jgi:thiazole synthase
MMDAALKVADRTFASRLLLGTGKYRSHAEMKACREASGTDMVTVAVRRVDLTGRVGPEHPRFHRPLEDRAPCRTRRAATPRTTPSAPPRLGREALGTPWVKLEALGDPETLWP